MLNNPLAFTDPSGYFSFGHFLHSLLNPRTIIALVVGFVFQQYEIIPALAPSIGLTQAVSQGIVVGAITGGISGGNLKSVLTGRISGGIFGAVGDFNETYTTASNLEHATIDQESGLVTHTASLAQKVVTHAIAGGITSVIQGGSLRSGFLSAGFAEFAGPAIGGLDLGPAGTGIARIAVGGTAAVIGGGKFENGAVTAAYAYMFNFLSHPALRAVVPGQVLYDNGVTAIDEGRYGAAVASFVGMLGEQVLTVLTLGAYQPEAALGRMAIDTAAEELSPSAGMLRAFQRQLDDHGVDSLLKSRDTIQQLLNTHLEKLPSLQYKSSVVREIRNFQKQLNAIDQLLK